MKKLLVALIMGLALIVAPSFVSAGFIGLGNFDLRTRLEVSRDQIYWYNYNAETNPSGGVLNALAGDTLYFRFKSWNVGLLGAVDVAFSGTVDGTEYFEAFDPFEGGIVGTNPDLDGDAKDYNFVSADLEEGTFEFSIESLSANTWEASGSQNGIMVANLDAAAPSDTEITVTVQIDSATDEAVFNNLWLPRAYADEQATSVVKIAIVDELSSSIPDPGDIPHYSWNLSNLGCSGSGYYIDSYNGYLYSGCMYSNGDSSAWRIEKRDAVSGELEENFGEDGIIETDPGESGGSVFAIVADASGLYIAGSADSQWWLEKRDLTTGALVTAFDTDGIVANGIGGWITSLAVGSDCLYIAGNDYSPGTNSQWRIEKRNLTTGALMVAFDTDGVVTENQSADDDGIYAMALNDSGLYIVGSDASLGDYQGRIEKRNLTTGALVTAFDSDGVAIINPSEDFDEAYSIALNDSGLYVTGYESALGKYQWHIEKRDLTTGSLIPAFGTGGVITEKLYEAEEENAMNVVLNDYSLYIAGYSYGGELGGENLSVRIEKRDLITGGLDNSFDTDGIMIYNPLPTAERNDDMAIDQTGIYVSGSSNSNGFLVKYGFPQDTTPPEFVNLPGLGAVVNLSNGQTIDDPLYTVYVKPEDRVAVDYVEFYVDGVLICTDNTPDVNGVYGCVWDTTLYHSDVQVLAYDTAGNRSIALNRTAYIDTDGDGLPDTGMSAWIYLLGLVVVAGPALLRRKSHKS
jgi:hypothetical protein